MHTLNLTSSELELLGSIVGHCLTGHQQRLVDGIYTKLVDLYHAESFPEPAIDKNLSHSGHVYLLPPMTGCVVSFNIPPERREEAMRVLDHHIRCMGGKVIEP